MDKIEEIAKELAKLSKPFAECFWPEYVLHAEAAYNKTLQLIREPTEEMVNAGKEVGRNSHKQTHRQWLTKVFTAMIDTLLEKGTET